MIVGTPTAEMKDRFTRVLKGHISLATLRFPEGTIGAAIDAFARRALWDVGLDYDHGTGHGVGSYLSVHEGPQSISKKPITQALVAGMICSNEPGFYKTGEYGIRIENLVVVTEPEDLPGCDRKTDALRDHHAGADRSRTGRAVAADRRRNATGSTPITRACARRWRRISMPKRRPGSKTRRGRSDMRKTGEFPAGRVERLVLDSALLKGNLLGDPTQRIIDVYVPAGQRQRPAAARRRGGFHRGRAGPHQLEEFRRERAGTARPADRHRARCRLSSSRFQTASRNWAETSTSTARRWGRGTMSCAPRSCRWSRNAFPAAARASADLFGKSSGGYGAIAHALLHPDFWAAAACHSGDMGFEHCAICRNSRACCARCPRPTTISANGSTVLGGAEDEGQRHPRPDDAGDVRHLRSRPDGALRHPPAGRSCTPAKSLPSAGRISGNGIRSISPIRMAPA